MNLKKCEYISWWNLYCLSQCREVGLCVQPIVCLFEICQYNMDCTWEYINETNKRILHQVRIQCDIFWLTIVEVHDGSIICAIDGNIRYNVRLKMVTQIPCTFMFVKVGCCLLLFIHVCLPLSLFAFHLSTVWLP